ncbi:MAG: hypothetical protein WCE44_04855 [Candidatus Velthaea sp.]
MTFRVRAAATAAVLAIPLLGLDSGAPATAHRTITTASPESQRWFDAGLARLYAFNIGESREDFARAAKADPGAAMPYWGLMVVETEDINHPTTAAGEVRARSALAAARERRASPQERALIAATGVRFTTPGPMDRKYRALRAAMRAFVDRYPDDPDAADLALDAGLLVGEDFSDATGDLTAEGKRMAADAERAHVVDPGNLGEHHFAIHFWEQAKQPARALADADYLAGLAYEPGESHLPHMAGHIYVRLGALDRMLAVNQVAVANDAAYFAQGDGKSPGQQYMRTYHDHDVEFIAYGLTTVGLEDEALAAVAQTDPRLQAHTAIRLHRDVDAQRIVAPDDHFSLGILALRAGNYADEQTERDALAKQADADRVELAYLDGQRARVLGDPAAALAAFARGLQLERAGYIGDPRHQWWAPVGEAYGAELLRAGRPAEAERVFNDELKRFPHDPRLLYGVVAARKAQGIDDATDQSELIRTWRAPGAITLDQLG